MKLRRGIFMLLATKVQDMSVEELFAIIKPVLYLIPITIVIIAVIIGVKIYRSFAVKRMIAYMESVGLTESDKRNYLTNYLMRASQSDLIKHLRNCPVCGKKYSLKTQATNARGDITEDWNHDGCTFCCTKVYVEKEIQHKRYFAIKRKTTDSSKEDKWQKTFETLNGYIDFYKPYIDCTPDSFGNKITIDISLQ